MVIKSSMGEVACLLTNLKLKGILSTKRKLSGNKNYQLAEDNLELLTWKVWNKAKTTKVK